MSEKNKITLFEEGRKALPRAALLLGGVILGVILLLTDHMVPAQTAEADSALSASEEMEEYARALEEKICRFCEQVEGVGEASVTVSLESGYRRVYAQNDSTYVLVGSGAARGTVYLTEEPPEIGGIAVICTGGGNATVRQRLVGLLSAAYGIGTNKIYIAQAQK